MARQQMSLGRQLAILFSGLPGLALGLWVLVYLLVDEPAPALLSVQQQAVQAPEQDNAPVSAPNDKTHSVRRVSGRLDSRDLVIEDTMIEDGSAPVPSPVPSREADKPSQKPLIVIVLDDVGVNRAGAGAAIGLSKAVTLSFMTYADGVADMARQARDNGHDVMLHLPMEPKGDQDPGPQALLTSLSVAELKTRLNWGLSRFTGYIGVNNHMGSRFTEWTRGMRVVMEEIRQRRVFFMDSKTSPQSVVAREARRAGVPLLIRDIFLDNDYKNPETILAQLERAEKIAKRRGYVIAIGHPHRQTIAVLEQWFPLAKARGFKVATVSELTRFLRETN